MRFETINLGVAGPPGPASTVPGPQGPAGPQGIPGPPGGESGSVNGVAALREIAPVSGQTLHLNYHTTVGDLGAGNFYGVTGAAAGTYVDNDGTIIVPTGGDGSAAWLRVWDGIECHVGWFGAKCDHVTDDYQAIYKALSLFTNGRGSVGGFNPDGSIYGLRGVINFGPGCDFSQPLIVCTDGGYSINLVGNLGGVGAIAAGSYLRYTGPATYAAITFQANNSGIYNLNIVPGLAYNGVHATADNSINTTLSLPVTAGNDVVCTPAAMTYIQVDTRVGIDAGGSNYEIVTVSKITATTFTADFKKNHAAGVQVGHGPYSSGTRFHNCIFEAPYGPVPPNTTLTIAVSPGTDVLHTTNQPHNIRVGMPIRLDTRDDGQTVFVTSVPSTTTFTATITLPHPIGCPVKYASAGFLMGNTPSATVQISEMAFTSCFFRSNSVNYPHAGFRQNQGGNVKNVSFKDMRYAYLCIAFECTQSSGAYIIDGCIGAGITDTVFRIGNGSWTVTGLEDESVGARLMIGGVGVSGVWFVLIGSSLESTLHTDDVAVNYLGSFTAIGCSFVNARTGSSYAKIQVPAQLATWSSAVTLIACEFPGTTNVDDVLVWASGTPIGVPGTANKIIVLNCIGGAWGGGTKVPLRNILPVDGQGTATYNPPSLLANTADTAQTMTVTGAALGDLVEVSFSENLGEVLLRAWVSAANTVSYQFRNPTAGPLDIGSVSSTVKCRVKK